MAKKVRLVTSCTVQGGKEVGQYLLRELPRAHKGDAACHKAGNSRRSGHAESSAGGANTELQVEPKVKK